MLSALFCSIVVQQERVELNSPGYYELQKLIYESHTRLDDVVLKYEERSGKAPLISTGEEEIKMLGDQLRVTWKVKSGGIDQDAEAIYSTLRVLRIDHAKKSFNNLIHSVPVRRVDRLWVREYPEPKNQMFKLLYLSESHQVSWRSSTKFIFTEAKEAEFKVLKNGEPGTLPATTYTYRLEDSFSEYVAAHVTVSSEPLILLSLKFTQAETSASEQSVLHNYTLKRVQFEAGLKPEDFELKPGALDGYKPSLGGQPVPQRP